jgi:aryl-alcohol dehydrogenase-like predicted oxidoreductase
LRGIDASVALKLAGVHAVWTSTDVAHIPPIGFRLTGLAALEPYQQHVLAHGKVRYVGHSNLEATQVEEVDAICRKHGFARPVSAQNEYSLLRREAEAELLPTCAGLGIGVLPYFPLASGLLTGKYRRGQPRPKGTRLSDREAVFTDETFGRLEALEGFAAERGVTLLQVAIGGLLARPAIASVIAGATKPEQVRANVEAAAWEPTAEDLAELSSLR